MSVELPERTASGWPSHFPSEFTKAESLLALAKVFMLYTAVLPPAAKLAAVWEMPSSTKVLGVVKVACVEGNHRLDLYFLAVIIYLWTSVNHGYDHSDSTFGEGGRSSGSEYTMASLHRLLYASSWL